MKVRIESDGSITGTRIKDGEGRDLAARVCGVRFSHDAAGVPEAELTLQMVEFEYEGNARMIGPNGKQVRRIEYSDGSEDVFE